MLTSFQQRYPAQFSSVILTPPTATFQGTFTLYGGDLTVELFDAPGHRLDHIAAWIPELRLLLAFDAVEIPIPLIKNVAGVPSMFTTLEHFLQLNPQTVLCSHGRTASPDSIKANVAYLHKVERLCRTLLSQRLPGKAELDQPETLIGYSFEEALNDIEQIIQTSAPFDPAFYRESHEMNIQHIFQWLMG
uniref:Metallo-beta-lactamase domain-containing protein n=1 Tax=Thermosporothrix sp. COM3 TaxID=2490863 RepID=A0A455SKP0_9CHLR|nr:hypothetical protein KTC_22700 [Thermosporothrix sp. COM3]